MILVDGIPAFMVGDEPLRACTSAGSAFAGCARFVARIGLASGKLDWLVERTPTKLTESMVRLPRRIDLFGSGSQLWVSKSTRVVAELLATECGGMNVSARDAQTAKLLWEHLVPIPDPAEWAEVTPAWPGAPTEEIVGFIAQDAGRLIVCLARQTRRSMCSSPTVNVMTLPPYACQLDATRFDPRTGKRIWSAAFRDVPVRIIERMSFTGIWSNGRCLGRIDFESGNNAVLHESPYLLGWPVQDGDEIAVPWHGPAEVGVDWVTTGGCQVRTGAWRQPRVNKTLLHPTQAGLGMQGNDQTFWWLGTERAPMWQVRAKPYIYRVHRGPGTDVFIGTDGMGGRLLGLDPGSGRETLNLKPKLGGVGYLSRVLGHQVLVSTYCVSRSYSVLPRLLVLSMTDRAYSLANECVHLLTTWEHGVVCRAGRHGERLAIIDIRSAEG
jgi:hypothetical protein